MQNEKNSCVTKPACIWIGTIPHSPLYDLNVRLDAVKYAKGQLELSESGYKHWQLIVHLGKPQRLSHLVKIFGTGTHWEPTKSAAAEEYVWKEDTRVAGTQFEHGSRGFNPNSSVDWEAVRDYAKRGELENIPASVYVRCYQQLRRIECDNLKPVAVERKVYVYWGGTGLGKSRLAWEQAGLEAFPKDPRTKFWDGYRGHEHVVIDEFRGGIDISHMLRWLDRYPVVVEIKGSSTVLKAHTIWITSNLDPRLWYPDLDSETISALLRRMEIKHFVM